MATGTFTYTYDLAALTGATPTQIIPYIWQDLMDVRGFLMGGLKEGNFASTTAIPGSKIAPGTINSTNIANAGVGSADIASSAIVRRHIASAAVGASEIDNTSAPLVQCGSAGMKLVRGTKAFSIDTSSTTATLTVTIASDCDETPASFPSTNLRLSNLAVRAADPGVAWAIAYCTALSSTSITVVVRTAAAPGSTWSGTVDWEVSGT